MPWEEQLLVEVSAEAEVGWQILGMPGGRGEGVAEGELGESGLEGGGEGGSSRGDSCCWCWWRVWAYRRVRGMV